MTSRSRILKYFLQQAFAHNILELSDSIDNISYDSECQTGGNITKNMSRVTNKKKWSSLVHNGVKFSPEYKQKHVPIIYDGKQIQLDKDAEEYALLYAKYLDTEYAQKNIFHKNFFNDWKEILGKKSEIKSLELCDFTLMEQFLSEEKEQKKIERKEGLEKKEKKIDDDDSEYKIALVDGKEQEISNYKVEPPGLFIGRGKNPNLGKIKKRIYPEDVTINIGKESPIPKLPRYLNGHSWGNIINDRKLEWLASWKDTVTNKTKYLWLSGNSDLKISGDVQKFEIARKLKKKYNTIIETNNDNLKSTDVKIRQIATALYFIDKLAIRVGNEKGDDGADTVGVTNLRIEHVDISINNEITLNFLGKDSVPYTNTIIVGSVVFNNVKEFTKKKAKDDQVFDAINSSDVNSYLQSFMKNLTAKVFRTYNASNIFQKELRKITTKYGKYDTDSDEEGQKKAIVDDFIKANLKVAKLLNHQKKISKGYKGQVDKINETVEKLKKQLAKARRSKNKKPATIEKIKEKIKNYKSKKEIVKEMKNISLDTSKSNYVDPRIMVAFMKKHDLDVNKIFSKALQKKFLWAFDIDESYKF